MKTQSGSGAFSLAFGSLMAALGTVIMLAGGIIPVLTYCSPIIAGTLLVAVKEETGNGSAWMVWAVTGMLSLLIGVDKEAAFFYVFLGWYPILKPVFDRLKNPVRRIVKTAVFAAALAAMYGLTCFVLGIDEIAGTFSAVAWINVCFFAGMILCMGLYDRALGGLILMYRIKLRPKLKFLRRK